MPLIDWIEDDDADGELAEIYAEYLQGRPDRANMPGILKCFSQRPDFLRRVIQFSNELHFSGWPSELPHQGADRIAGLRVESVPLLTGVAHFLPAGAGS